MSSDLNGGGLHTELTNEDKIETIEEFAARIRAQRWPSSQVQQCEQLAAAIRRSAKRGIDPEHLEELAEFDTLLRLAMQRLNEVTRLLYSVRERVDLAKIKAERERRAEFLAARGGAITARARVIPAGVSQRRMKASVLALLRRLSPEERARVLATM